MPTIANRQADSHGLQVVTCQCIIRVTHGLQHSRWPVYVVLFSMFCWLVDTRQTPESSTCRCLDVNSVLGSMVSPSGCGTTLKKEGLSASAASLNNDWHVTSHTPHVRSNILLFFSRFKILSLTSFKVEQAHPPRSTTFNIASGNPGRNCGPWLSSRSPWTQDK